MSERRACRFIEAERKTVRYRSRRPRDDALRERLHELAASAAGSATGGCLSSCARRAALGTARSRNGSTARKA